MTKISKKKIVFLYTELAQYFMACLSELKKYNWEIHVFHWPVNDEAPFRFQFPEGIHFYVESELTLSAISEKIDSIDPSILVVSGWMDRDYLKISKKWTQDKIVIMGLDNPWKGSLKQNIWVLLSKIVLHNSVTHIWAAGRLQKLYAEKLGFSSENILLDLYSADVEQFRTYYERNLPAKKIKMPKRFLFVGRYTKKKGIFNLWKAFSQMQEEHPSDWELWCLGTGEEFENRVIHPKIKHKGFIQPYDLENFVKETSVFVLPSLYEPWGLVVHEFSAAGFPLIISDQVGAIERFVQANENGFIFQGRDVNSLKNALYRITQMTDSEIFNMGAKSAEIANLVNPKEWAVQLEDLL